MRKRVLIAIAAVASLSLVGSLVATGADDFIDVPDSNIFHDDISWMEENGITFGYGDGRYGPDDFVIRGQMAAFMHRLYDRIQEDIPEQITPEAVAEAFAEANVNIDSICEIFGLEPGDECQEGLADVLRGEQGPQGPEGPEGPEGPPGADGADGVAVVTHATGKWTGDDFPAANNRYTVECPVGTAAVGGGYKWEVAGLDHNVSGDRPGAWLDAETPGGWVVEGTSEAGQTGIDVWAVCVEVTPAPAS